MLSKTLCQCLLTSSLLMAACSPKSIPRYNKAIIDSEVKEEVVKTNNRVDEQVVDKKIRYSADVIKLTKQLQSLQPNETASFYMKIANRLYGEESQDKVFYQSAAYGGLLEVLTSLYIKAKENNRPVASQILSDFYDFFLSSCVEQSTGLCERLQHSLAQEKQTILLILEASEQQKDPLLKLKVLGAAYDLKSRRENKKLDEMYFQVALDVLTSVEVGKLSVTKKLIRKHLVNLLAINSQIHWDKITPTRIKQYVEIAPWQYNEKSNKALDELRYQLVTFLPSYFQKSEVIQKGLSKKIEETLQKASKNKKNLKQYPAFSNIDIKSVLQTNKLSAYLATQLYFQNIPVSVANSFVANIIKPGPVVEEIFSILKVLVRWDVAQLSLDSTEKLNQKFSQQETKTNAFFQETLDWSKSLVPMWTEFHTIRLWSARSFLDANIRLSELKDEEDIREFFGAVNRNILKTTVYPNMMAFAYFMAKTEWMAKVRVFWIEFKIDTTMVMDSMMTGHYTMPWFNFTNLKEDAGWRMEEKTALYRSEMLDALYYFYTTRAFEVYGINPDDFLKITAETIFKRRRSTYEATLEMQKNLYLPDNTVPSRMINWCESIQSNKNAEENLPFYWLGNYITPFNKLMDRSEINIRRNMFFGDWYQGNHKINQKSIIGESYMTTLDRYRLEFGPIFKALLNYREVAQRAAQKYPQLKIGNFENSNELLNEYRLLKLRFLGLSKHIAKRMLNCMFVASEETKRRIKANAFAQSLYFSQVIHPLMGLVKDGSMQVGEANNIIKEFHNNQPGVFDEIQVSNSGHVQFILSKQTYFLRVRDFLIKGKTFSHDRTGSVNIEPIVGPHLTISIPDNFLSDKENNQFIERTSFVPDYMKTFYNDDAEAFARDLSAKTTDRGRSIVSDSRFTSWDPYDGKKYVEYLRYAVEFEVQMYQMPGGEYLDYGNPECLALSIDELPSDCIKHNKADINNILNLMRKIVDVYRLTPDDQEYFALTNQQGWVGSEALNTVVALDTSVPHDFTSNSLPYSRLRGILDFPRIMLAEDYLGFTFLTEWDVELMKGQDRPGDLSCEGRRQGCYWKNEKIVAQEFFLAREKKPKLIFDMDLEIIQSDYRAVADNVKRKFGRVVSLEEKREQYLQKIKADAGSWGDHILINMYKSPSPIEAISTRYLNYQRDSEMFFSELTEGYFIKEPNWDSYIIK